MAGRGRQRTSLANASSSANGSKPAAKRARRYHNGAQPSWKLLTAAKLNRRSLSGTLDIRGFSTRRRQLLCGTAVEVELVTATREQTAFSP
jgi:hypothetical protein